MRATLNWIPFGRVLALALPLAACANGQIPRAFTDADRDAALGDDTESIDVADATHGRLDRCPTPETVAHGEPCAVSFGTYCRARSGCYQCSTSRWTTESPQCLCESGRWNCSVAVDCVGRCDHYTDPMCQTLDPCDAGPRDVARGPCGCTVDVGCGYVRAVDRRVCCNEHWDPHPHLWCIDFMHCGTYEWLSAEGCPHSFTAFWRCLECPGDAGPTPDAFDVADAAAMPD